MERWGKKNSQHWLGFENPENMFWTDEGETEVAQIRAVLSPAWGSPSRPLLVLSCISREFPEAASLQNIASTNRSWCRTPCVNMATRLGLPCLANPWMVTPVQCYKDSNNVSYRQHNVRLYPCHLCFRCRTRWQNPCRVFWRVFRGCWDALESKSAVASFLTPTRTIQTTRRCGTPTSRWHFPRNVYGERRTNEDRNSTHEMLWIGWAIIMMSKHYSSGRSDTWPIYIHGMSYVKDVE